MSRQTTSLKQGTGRYIQGGYTDYYAFGYNVGGTPERLGWWEKRDIPKSYDDVYLIVSKGSEGRPDLISYQVYGQSDFAWLVMQYNSIVDPVQELFRGRKIRMPNDSRLRIYIINQPTRTF